MDDNRDEATKEVVNGLKNLYHTKLKPLEEAYLYHNFHSPLLTDSEFDSKPQVLMIGQYSTGKTSFIRYVLGRDFPGQRIGPEPTTDRFVTVMYNEDERVIPGNALAVHPELPYRGLDRFGVSFLNRLEGSQLPCPVLKNITMVDTPGILSGEKQRLARGYDFLNVVGWFAERADLILLLFDAHKLDISDEFKAVIEKLKGHDDKIRCVLNKADQVDRQKLMRVYGALMWSIGKVLKTPEVLRVYVGSFWDEPLYFDDNAELFEMEERYLMQDLRNLPRNSALRKINELVKRTRLAKVHAYILGYLKSQIPMIGREKKQAKLIDELPMVFRTCMKQYNLAPGDFPDIEQFKEKLRDMNFSKFPKLNMKMIVKVEEVLSSDIPRLIEMLPRNYTPEQLLALQANNKQSPMEADYDRKPPPPPAQLVANPTSTPVSPRGAPSWADPPLSARSAENPFSAAPANPFEDDGGGSAWALESQRDDYSQQFQLHGPIGGKLSANKAREALMATGLAVEKLRGIWELSDMDKDGALDVEEFMVAMYLCEASQNGEDINGPLPIELIPPSKR